MNETKKMNAAKQALKHLKAHERIGMGTGSTVECLIDLLSDESWAHNRRYVVSSQRTYHCMHAHGFEHIETAEQNAQLDVYIDGADWIDAQGYAIKGYGGALTQEKLLASMSTRRIAIVDDQKVVEHLSHLCQPLPIEVVNAGRSYVAQALPEGTALVYRSIKSDQGQSLGDIFNLVWQDAAATERWLKSICGVIESGLFAVHPFHEVLIGY